MTKQRQVNCIKHGEQPETFVCQHIAHGLEIKQPTGFYWSQDTIQEYPDAWCEGCNERLRDNGWEWQGEAIEQLGVKLLCAECYMSAKIMNGF